MWRCCSLHTLLPLCCSDAATHPDCHLASFGSVTLDTPMNRKFMPKADFSTWTPLEYIAEWVPKQSFSLLCFYLDWGCVYMFLSIFKWWNVQDVQFYRSPIMENSNCTLLGHSHFKLIYFLNALISFNCCTAPLRVSVHNGPPADSQLFTLLLRWCGQRNRISFWLFSIGLRSSLILRDWHRNRHIYLWCLGSQKHFQLSNYVTLKWLEIPEDV